MRHLLGIPLWFATIAFSAAGAPLATRLVPNVPSPQPVGTPVGFTPRIENASKGMHVYRYSVSMDDGAFHVLRDFSQEPGWVWSPALYEHRAVVRLTVRNNDTKETAQAEVAFLMVSRVKGSTPRATPTAHPLVALFSAPACSGGAEFRVAFRREGDETVSYTPLQPCRASLSNNVYVAGMRPDTDYRMRQELVTGGSVKPGGWLPFHTGIADGDFPAVSIALGRTSGAGVREPVLIQAGRPVTATDLEGNLIWYQRSQTSLMRVAPGGRFFGVAEGRNSANDMRRAQLLREVDLAGNVLRETNVSRVAEQLDRFGIRSDCRTGAKECVSGFHHEVLPLPNGHTLAIAGLERILPAGTQGAKDEVDVLGDIVVDLDEDFQVAHVWNGFDHLDIKRKSLGDAKCRFGAGGGGCPPVFLSTTGANGWTHSNALNYIVKTGDFLISMPEQNWVAKIDWKNGTSSGKVLWRLGEAGDFTAKSADAHPWFSYQHDPAFDPVGSDMLTILDDGEERFKNDRKAHTRGQVWKIDEGARTATLVVNADLGVYSPAVGSAQRLTNGGYSFVAGYLNMPHAPYGRSIETTADGTLVYAQQVESSMYRTFRVESLYSGPAK